MQNIWELLLQTLEISVFALLVLLLKWLFLDKLSPRWQYGVWGLLALRLLLPTGLGERYLVPQTALWLETVKAGAELGRNSAYTGAFMPLDIRAPLPMATLAAPRSITDWLFLLYLAGFFFFLLRPLWGYLRLRLLLRREGEAASAQQEEALAQVVARYALPSCRACVLKGLPSPFVCGIRSPVLVLPAGEMVDEKVLLHELLHRSHRDPLQGLLWSLLLAIHWYNPLLQYVRARIGNDLETLCDQRVLERLEGEERRDYGAVLLSMTNERYPRAPGTSSLSNGAGFIARRIEAIVRFRKYPRGMALVSVCIAFVLLSPAVFGFSKVELVERDHSGGLPELPFVPPSQQEMAAARLRRAGTIAGALDTFSRAVSEQNPIYLAAVSPLAEQEQVLRAAEQGGLPWQLPADASFPLETRFYNLEEQADGSISCLLFYEENLERPDGTRGYTLPLRVYEELGGGFVVEPQGQLEPLYLGDAGSTEDALPVLRRYEVPCQTGSFLVEERSKFCIDEEQIGSQLLFGIPVPRRQANPDADFGMNMASKNAEYTYNDPTADESGPHPQELSFLMRPLETGEESEEEIAAGFTIEPNGTISSSGELSARAPVTKLGEAGVKGGGGSSFDWDKKTGCDVYPPAYGVQIFFDGELRETFVIRREEAE